MKMDSNPQHLKCVFKFFILLLQEDNLIKFSNNNLTAWVAIPLKEVADRKKNIEPKVPCTGNFFFFF